MVPNVSLYCIFVDLLSLQLLWEDYADRILCLSGDIGHLDEENFLFISDRAKEIIIRGGENISSIAVENAFYVDSRIKDAAVVPVKDDAMGELVALVPSFAFHIRAIH